MKKIPRISDTYRGELRIVVRHGGEVKEIMIQHDEETPIWRYARQAFRRLFEKQVMSDAASAFRIDPHNTSDGRLWVELAPGAQLGPLL